MSFFGNRKSITLTDSTSRCGLPPETPHIQVDCRRRNRHQVLHRHVGCRPGVLGNQGAGCCAQEQAAEEGVCASQHIPRRGHRRSRSQAVRAFSRGHHPELGGEGGLTGWKPRCTRHKVGLPVRALTDAARSGQLGALSGIYRCDSQSSRSLDRFVLCKITLLKRCCNKHHSISTW